MNKCIYDYTYGILKYPLVALFLIDYRLTWKRTQAELRGDIARNLSGGLAKYFGFIGGLLKWLKK